jgi:hypothetical protein
MRTISRVSSLLMWREVRALVAGIALHGRGEAVYRVASRSRRRSPCSVVMRSRAFGRSRLRDQRCVGWGWPPSSAVGIVVPERLGPDR